MREESLSSDTPQVPAATTAEAPAIPPGTPEDFGTGMTAVDGTRMQSFIWYPHATGRAEVNNSAWALDEVDRKARALYMNSPIAARIVDGIALKVCGNGFTLKCLTKDKAWNRRVEDMWIEESKAPSVLDASGNVTLHEAGLFHQAQKMLRGEQFTALVKSRRNAAQFYLYDRNDIRTPPTGSAKFEAWKNGVRTVRPDRIASYLVAEDDDKATPIEAANMIHYRDSKHARGVRGVSWFMRALSHLVDVTDIQRFTKDGIKMAAEVGFYATKGPSGAVNGDGFGNNVDSDALNEATLPDGAKVKDLYGGRMIELATGEIKVIRDDRPGPNGTAFIWDLLASCVLAFGASPQLLLDVTKLNNQQGRLAIQTESPFIAQQQGHLANRFYSRFFLYWLFTKIKNGRLPLPKDPQPWLHGWLVPKNATLDVGRDGKLELAQHESGFVTLASIFGSRSLHWESELEQFMNEKVIRWNMIQERKAENPGMTDEDFLPVRQGAAPPPSPDKPTKKPKDPAPNS